MTFRLGTASSDRLRDCQLDLARTIRLAIEQSEVDFQVYEVRRDLERQRELYASGASRTLDSFHLPDAEGVSHAADLVPWIGGKLQWQSRPCTLVAKAMHRAAMQTATTITWGAVWDRHLTELAVHDLEGEVEAYVERWRWKHPRPTGHAGYWGPLIDRPHFQVPRKAA